MHPDTLIPQLWVLVGGNGAGKSTFYEYFLLPKGVPFINADIIARQMYPENPESFSYQAAEKAGLRRDELLESKQTFCFETVYSHPSKIDFIAKAKSYGYQVFLIMIGLGDEGLHVGRVNQRVHEGGHSVPEQKIRSRISRTKKHIKESIPLVDELWVLDNSSSDAPFQLQLKFYKGKVKQQSDELQSWVVEMFQEYITYT